MIRTTGRLALAALLLLAAANARAAEDAWTGIERVVAIGDIHADYDQLVAALQSAGLVDERLRWTGGATHLVQTGDFLDRGNQSRKVMDLLYKLEGQARKAKGRVHVLIGNHEVLNILGDLRYVTPVDLASYGATQEVERESGKPEGWAEHLRQFGPDGQYGRWIRGLNAVIRIDDTIFLHGGISPKLAQTPLREINERVRRELSLRVLPRDALVTAEDGPMWYRGLANGDERALAPHVDEVLKNFGAQRIVIGHTFADGAVTPRFGGKVLMIDIGLARLYDSFYRLACLVIEKGKPYALHQGTPLELPADTGPGLLRYLRAAAEAGAKPSPLAARIAALESNLGGAH